MSDLRREAERLESELLEAFGKIDDPPLEMVERVVQALKTLKSIREGKA